MKHTILFLAANPRGTDPRTLDREASAIQEELERSGRRDRFAFETRWAVEPLDLLRELRTLRPTVVHFSGRGCRGEDGAPHSLVFQGRDGQARLVSIQAIEQTFGAAGAPVQLVVLSACHTEAQAEALLAHVDCVIGMSGSIGDDAARSFAIGFYGGLGERVSVADAYKQGCAAISLEGPHESDRPLLAIRDGVDASKLILAANPAEPPSDRSETIDVTIDRQRHHGREVRTRRSWIGLAVVSLAVISLALVAAWKLMRAPVHDPATVDAVTRETVIVVGSGTVLWGFLDPARRLIESLSGLSVPVSKDYDFGSTHALDVVRGVGDIAAQSSRFTAEVQNNQDYVRKVLIEVVIGFDESLFFVHHSNPLPSLDIAALQALCCVDPKSARNLKWHALGVAKGHPMSQDDVNWIIGGRTDNLRRGDISGTVQLAESWICQKPGTAFCRPPGSGRTYLHEAPMEVAEDPRSLGLSARSFKRPGVRRIDIVDRKHGRRLNGRKPLWLYIRTDAERPLPPKICRFLDAVLDRRVRTLLEERGASEGLADDLLVRQRSALGLDDGTCGEVMTWPSPPGGLDRGGFLVESPIAKAVEVERWIAH
jgi:hypothetical protein